MDRLDLENSISDLYSIVDHMEDISYGILEEYLTRDDAVNAISGLSMLTKIKLEKLFNTFVQVFDLDRNSTSINHDETDWF